MKKALVICLALLMVCGVVFSAFGCAADAPANVEPDTSSGESKQGTSVLQGDPSEVYYMITFMSELDFWKDCFRGMEDAATQLGVKVEYTGCEDFDINQEVTVLEQVISTNPKGIAITCVNDEALADPINKALEQGIQVITFDNPSYSSNADTVIRSDSLTAGQAAGEYMAGLCGGKGTVAVMYVAGTTNHEQRAQGFREVIAANYPDMEVVDALITGDQDNGAQVMSSLIQANPDIVGAFTCTADPTLGIIQAVAEAGIEDQVHIIGFDTDTTLLDAIKAGTCDATVAQGSYNEGYWAMHMLYHAVHELPNPVNNWKENGMNPLPVNIDTGVNIVNAENVDSFYMAE